MKFSRNTTTFALGRLRSGEMNKTEKAYSEYLRGLQSVNEVIWWRFEGMKFRLADNTFYTPDFAVMLPNGMIEIHEIKGSLSFIQDDAKVKIKVAAEMYPFQFRLIAPKAKKYGGGWEVKEIG